MFFLYVFKSKYFFPFDHLLNSISANCCVLSLVLISGHPIANKSFSVGSLPLTPSVFDDLSYVVLKIWSASSVEVLLTVLAGFGYAKVFASFCTGTTTSGMISKALSLDRCFSVGIFFIGILRLLPAV